MWNSDNKKKVTVVGEFNAGKTSLIYRYMYDNFQRNYIATIGVDFLSCDMNVGENRIRLQIWDTAGQERFKSLVPSYMRNADVVVIVFDVTEKDALEKAHMWTEIAKRESSAELLVLVGNKTDLTDKRIILTKEGELLASDNSMMYGETSSKTGEGVKELFGRIGSSLITLDERQRESEDTDDLVSVTLSTTDKTESLSEPNCVCSLK